MAAQPTAEGEAMTRTLLAMTLVVMASCRSGSVEPRARPQPTLPRGLDGITCPVGTSLRVGYLRDSVTVIVSCER